MPYPILTKEPNSIEEGKSLILFRRKSTTKQPVADADKFRGIVVPAFTLPTAVLIAAPTKEEGEAEELTYSDADDAFQAAIRDAFFDAAGEILKAFCDHNKEAKEVSEEAFTFDAIVAQMQASVASKRLNQEMIAEAYDGSATALDAAKRYGEDATGKKKQQALREHFLSLASNNPGIPVTLAVKMLSYIQEQDATNAVFQALAKKLDTLAKKDTSDDL